MMAFEMALRLFHRSNNNQPTNSDLTSPGRAVGLAVGVAVAVVGGGAELPRCELTGKCVKSSNMVTGADSVFRLSLYMFIIPFMISEKTE